VIWEQWSLSKYSFILWLAVLGKLRTREIVEPTGLKKSYAWDIKDPAPVDQLLIKVILDSESPQCCKMRSLTEMIAFHSREVE
jgi:hypothetical protein